MLTIQIANLHPSITSILASIGSDPAAVLTEVNDELREIGVKDAKSKVGFKVSIARSGEDKGKTMFTMRASERLTTMPSPETPALRLAQVTTYLEAAAEMFLRVETVSLPLSVLTWVSAKRFRVEEWNDGEKATEFNKAYQTLSALYA